MEELVKFVNGSSSSNTNYVLNNMETIKKLKKAAAAPKDMDIKENGIHGRTIRFSAGAYMSVVNPLVKDWEKVLATGSWRCRM